MLPLAGLACAVPLGAQDGYAPRGFDDDEADGIEVVAIRHFRLEPYANLSYLDDLLTVHPKAVVGLGYNSNLYQTADDEVGDWYTSGVAAVDLRYELDEVSAWKLGLEGFFKDHVERDDRDMVGGRGTFDLHAEGTVWKVDAAASFERRDDPLVETGRDVLVQTWGALLDVTRNGNLTKVGAGLDFARVNYLEDSTSFAEDERDRIRYGASVFVKRDIGVDSHWRARLGWFRVDYDRDVAADREAEAAEAILVEKVDAAWLGYSRWYYHQDSIGWPALPEALTQYAVSRVDLANPGFARYYYANEQYRDRPPTTEELWLAAAWPVISANPGSRSLYRYLRHGDDSPYQDSDNLRLATGGQFSLTDRLRLTGDVGLEARRFDDPYGDRAAYGDELVWFPVGEASLRWQYADGGRLRLSAYYRLLDGVSANVSAIGRVALHWEHRLPSRVDLFGELAWVDRVDSGADDNQRVYRSNSASAKLGLGYRLPRGFSGRISGEYRIFDSNLPGDEYKQLLAQLELAAVF